MLTVEEQIAHLADAALELSMTSAPVLEERGSHRAGQPKRQRWTFLAAVGLVVLLVGALTWTARRQFPSEGPAQQSPTQPTNQPTVDYPVGETWLVPTYLPDDLTFELAEQLLDDEIVIYESPTYSTAVSVAVGSSVTRGWEADRQLDIDGIEWNVAESAHDPDLTILFRKLPDGIGVVVQSRGLDEETLHMLVASITLQPVTSLPRPPIPLVSGGVLVAAADQDGVPKRLLAHTDGVYFAFEMDGGGGGAIRLGDKAFVTSGASGPNPNLVPDGNSAESLIWGLANSDVATIDIELTGGRVITSATQDLTDQFIENFSFIALPTGTEEGLELVAAIVARDDAGTELARTNGVFQ